MGLENALTQPGRIAIGGAPGGFDALVLATLARGREVLFVARDDAALARMAEALAFFAPEVACLQFPAWDCLPYDRVSPHADVVARRIDTLTRLLDPGERHRGRVVLTTVSAFAQRVPPRSSFAEATRTLRIGDADGPEVLVAFLERNGYGRSDTVMEPGEFAVRGGIVDIFPPGSEEPLRLDFFGDDLDGIRCFDPATQRTTGKRDEAVLKPVSEVPARRLQLI